MFFESRSRPPEPSPPWARCAELFAAGRVREARREALALRRAGGFERGADALLAYDLSRGSSFHLESFAVVELARRQFPDDRRVRFEWTRILAARGRLQASVRAIQELIDTAPRGERPLLHALLASTYAQLGFAGRAADETRAAGDAAVGDPLVGYELATAAVSLQSWEEAIARGRKVVELAPRWPRARLFLAEALLAHGHSGEARRTVEEGLAGGFEDAALELVVGLQAFHDGDHPEALRRLVDYELTWQRPRRRESVRRILPLLPWDLDALGGELDRLAGLDPELREQLDAAGGPGARRFLAIPAIRQERLLCVPTSVAMSAAAQGVTLDPRELFAAMTGRHGTPMWRMVDEMRRRGFVVEYVQARPEAVRDLLDQGVPLVGQIEGLFQGHVEVICGYDEGRDLYYVRDPESWIPGVLEGPGLGGRYSLSGGGLVALVPPERVAEVELPRRFWAPVAEALVDLERAVVAGDRRAAEEAYEAVPGDSPAVFRRDTLGRHVTLTPQQSARAMEAIARDAEAHPLVRLQAVLSLDSAEVLEEVRATLESAHFSRYAVALVGLLESSYRGDWERVRRDSEALLERFPQMESLWISHAEASARLGELETARQSAASALELAPDAAWVRNRVRTLFPARRPLEVELAEVRDLRERYPDNRELCQDLAALLSEDGDGLAYEGAELDCQRYFPRQPDSYARLAEWYLLQERDDKAADVLGRGRALIGADELPPWDFEEKHAGDEAAPPEQDEPEKAEPEKGELFVAARRALLQGQPTGEKVDVPALAALRELAHRGELHWHEAAELLALEIQYLALRQPKEEELLEALEKLLPETLDGPLASALYLVLHRTPSALLPRRGTVSLATWARRLAAEAPSSPAPLDFELACLDELRGNLDGAKRQYQALVKEHPGFAEPHYRLGVLLAEQGQLEASLEAHQRALASHPGLYGSIKAVIQLHLHLGDRAAALERQRDLCRLRPYDGGELEELLVGVMRDRGLEGAIAELGRRRELFPAGILAALEARLYAEDKRFTEALRILERHPEAARDDPRRTLRVELSAILAEDRFDDAEARVDEGLERHPGDEALLDLKCRLVMHRAGDEGSPEALAFFRQRLLSGVNLTSYAVGLLVQLKAQGTDTEDHLAEEDDPDARRTLAYALNAALAARGEHDDQVSLLRWCNRHLPELEDLRAELARQLTYRGDFSEAVDRAEELYRLDPESPVYLELMAFTLLDWKPAEALPYLRREYALSRSVETLSRIGHCQQATGKIELAVKTYRRVLEQAPGFEPVLVNLVALGEPAAELYDQFCLALERGAEGYPFFHLAAVEVGRLAKAPLPGTWLAGALRRLEVLAAGGQGNERVRLGLAIAVWLDRWGERERARQVRRRAGSWWRRFQELWRLDMFWPGTTWIPPRDASLIPPPPAPGRAAA